MSKPPPTDFTVQFEQAAVSARADKRGIRISEEVKPGVDSNLALLKGHYGIVFERLTNPDEVD